MRSLRVIKLFLIAAVLLTFTGFAAGVSHAESRAGTSPSIRYSAHVQDIGWQNEVKDGELAGTSGKSLRMESLKIHVANTGLYGSVEYRSHIQNIGWETNWKKDGQETGTTGSSLRLEGIQIRLTGQLAQQYDIYYCVHAQNLGWLAWAKNGEQAGSSGYSYRLEAIEIRLVKKGSPAPANIGTRTTAFVGAASVSYKAHVQDIGWQNPVSDGASAGTEGKSLRVEALTVTGISPNEGGTIQYRSHIQNIGWESAWKSAGQTSGTSGQSLRLEALQMKLTGQLAEDYDIYYCVHAQNVGWLAWAKNGEIAGTTGCSLRLEAVKIKILPKGSAAPANIGTTSFASSKCVTASEYQASLAKTETANSSSSKGQAVVDYARQFIGNPYVYGGCSLTNGTDCSGFTMSVMKHFGVSLPHGSNSQRAYGTQVSSLSAAQPGDLIFFSGHVGIYTGNGKMVHAANVRKGIVEDSVSYYGTVVEIRRMV